MKKLIVFLNTMKKFIVFGKHYEKINSVFGERPNISSALCSEFLLSCFKKKLIQGLLRFCVLKNLQRFEKEKDISIKSQSNTGTLAE